MDDFKLSKTIRKIVRNQKTVHDVVNSSAKKWQQICILLKVWSVDCLMLIKGLTKTK